MPIHIEIERKLADFTLSVSLSVDGGSVGILGASGSGKSMTLKCLAGIERPDRGVIVIDGETVFDSSRGIDLPPGRRRAGFLFQHYALFPTMTVADNIGIVFRERGVPRKEIPGRVAELVRMFRLDGLEKKLPAKISGGQQQRVALARALASSPRILMLDEPFSALDPHLKAHVELELSGLVAEFGIPVLFVSHDRDEVYRNCERVVVLDRGEVAAQNTREGLFANPGNVAAARLSGCKNIAPFVRSGERSVFVPEWGIALSAASTVPFWATHVGVRSHHIRDALPSDSLNRFDFFVGSVKYSPFSFSEYVLARSGTGALCRESGTDGSAPPRPREVSLCIPPDKILFLR